MGDSRQVWGDEMTIYGPSCAFGVGTPIPPPWTGADGVEPTSSEYSLHFKTTLVLRWVLSFVYFRWCGVELLGVVDRLPWAGLSPTGPSPRKGGPGVPGCIPLPLSRPEPNLNFQVNSITDVRLAPAHL